MNPENIGRYEIKSELGRGGMSTVYQAFDPRFKRLVAIKILAPQYLENATFRARFEREAQTIAALEHAAIVPVYDFGEENGQLYLVMRYMTGGSLSARLKEGPLSFDTAAQMISRLAPALDAVHAHGIVHRDLKPGNILFDQYDHAFISDFGIARLAQGAATLTGDMVLGTPAYMSPEQVRGDNDIDGRSDLYALGAILYEMLTGCQPYQATTPMGVAMKHVSEPVPRLLDAQAEAPPATQAVIDRAMAKERAQRYDHAAEMADDLKTISQGKPVAIPTRSIAAAPPVPVDKPPSVAADRTPLQVAPPPQVAPPLQVAPPPQVAPHPQAAARSGGVIRSGKFPVLIAGSLVVLLGVCALVAGLIFAGRSLFAGRFGSATATTASIAVVLPTPSPAATAAEGTVTQPAGPADTPAGDRATEDAPLPRPLSLFRDDFSDPASGWSTEADETIYVDYDHNGYRIRVEERDTIAWGTPELDFKDVSIEVEAVKVSGPDDNMLGVMCRIQDDSHFYVLAISSDGYYFIGKYVGDQLEPIGSDEWQFSDAIHQGKTTNRLRAECIGDELTLYVNDIKVSQVTDGDYASGDVGLAAAAFDLTGTEILFDNFVAQTR